jgi:hypothetical protein
LIWQFLYWRFVLVARREKIEKGGRITSFTYLLNDRKGVIGKLMSKIGPEHREWSFMLAQFVRCTIRVVIICLGGIDTDDACFARQIYTVITIAPPVFILYNSKFWSGVWLISFFAISVWNGGTFTIEVRATFYKQLCVFVADQTLLTCLE